MRSIIQEKDGTCYLCMILHGDYGQKTVQEHHVIFGTAGRKLSERYGLKVYLCLFHHTEGPEAVHNNAKNAKILKERAQKLFTERYPELDWMVIFGKNYMDQEDCNGKQQAETAGHDERYPEAAGFEETERTQRETICRCAEDGKKSSETEPGFQFITGGIEDLDW